MTENKEQLQDKVNLTVLPGNEKSLSYKILPVPNDRGRFGFTWDVLKNKLGNLIYVNLLMLLFFAPLIVVLFLREGSIFTSGALGAFGDNLGVGYPASPDMTGLAEALMLEVNTLYFALAVAASPFTAVGLAGGVYAIRKLLRSDDEFRLIKDFFTGVKKGYVASLVACVLSFAMIFVCVRVWDSASYEIVMGGNVALNIVFRVLACIGAAIVILFSLWLMSIGSNYKQNVWGLIKNSLSLGAGTFLQTIFFAVLGVVPVVLLFLGGFFSILVIAYFMILGFSAILIIWCSFTDWAFDNYADYTATQTDVQEEASKKIIAEETKETDIMSLLLVEGKTAYLSRAVQPLDEGAQAYALPDAFTERDLKLLAENKQKIRQESQAFAAAHAEEEGYKEYNARFADREKALTETDKKGKKKKFMPRMLNQ